MKNNNNISEYSDKKTNEDNTAKDHFNHRRSILRNENTENNVASIPKEPNVKNKMKHHRSRSIDLIKHNVLCCRMFIVFAMCCVIGCSLMPIIFYFAAQRGENVITYPEYSHVINTSSAEVCYKLISVHTVFMA